MNPRRIWWGSAALDPTLHLKSDRTCVREADSPVHFGKYLQAAFLNHWNLLVFLGGMGFALVSGRADMLLPLLLAGEIAYVGLLGSHPKFQAYVDAQAAKAERAQGSRASQQALDHILQKLPNDLLQRFQSLRTQCVELRRISLELKRPGMSADDVPLDQFQLSGLDRLLWIHLRLLYTQYALAQFLQKTPADPIEKDIQKLQDQLAKLPAPSGRSQRPTHPCGAGGQPRDEPRPADQFEQGPR